MLIIGKKIKQESYGTQGRTRWLYKLTCPDCKESILGVKNYAKKTKRCRICNNKNHSNSKIHGETKTLLFEKWNAMIHRCYGKRTDANKYWDNVTVCPEWRDNFLTFKKWSLKNGYKKKLHLDKDILCDKLNIYPKIYSPDTCLWITGFENTKQRNEHSPCLLYFKQCKQCNKDMLRGANHKYCTDECAKQFTKENRYD